METRAHPARVGLALVVSAAAVIAASVWLLPASHADKTLACIVAAAMVGGAFAWRTCSAGTRHPLYLLAYPLFVFSGLAALGNSTNDIAPSYGGFFTMAFIFIGLYCPARATFSMLVPAAIGWLFANGALADAPLRSLEVRLPISLIIWTLVGVLLSQHARAATRSTASLLREAQRDPLTGLRNRRILADVLGSAQAGDVVVLIDIDHFKSVNDEWGHAAGDALLVDFARVLVRGIRGQDLAVRFGGDEFLLYLPETTIAHAERVVARIHTDWARQSTSATFSAGVACVRIGRDGTDAFGEADRLLYEAKDAGRDQWVVPATIPIPAARQSEEDAVLGQVD